MEHTGNLYPTKIKNRIYPLIGNPTGKVIAFMNNKGGVGKTALTLAFAIYLSRCGKRVLMIDFDSQGNLTQKLSIHDDQIPELRIDNFLQTYGKDMNAMGILRHVVFMNIPHLSRKMESPVAPIMLIPGSRNAGTEANSLNDKLLRESSNLAAALKNALKHLKTYYEYILIDTAPGLDKPLLNTVAAENADEIVIPVDGIEAAWGIVKLTKWIAGVNNYTQKPNITVAMVKYAMDAGVQLESKGNNPDIMRSEIYRILKTTLGDYICRSGVKERRTYRLSIKNLTKQEWNELCWEILDKISLPNRPNFYESQAYLNIEHPIKKIKALKNRITPNVKWIKVNHAEMPRGAV